MKTGLFGAASILATLVVTTAASALTPLYPAPAASTEAAGRDNSDCPSGPLQLGASTYDSAADTSRLAGLPAARVPSLTITQGRGVGSNGSPFTVLGGYGGLAPSNVVGGVPMQRWDPSQRLAQLQENQQPPKTNELSVPHLRETCPENLRSRIR